MRKRIRAALVTLLMVAGITVAVASPAQASFDWCHGAGVICFAEHNDGNGTRWGPRSFPYGQCVTAPSNFRNKMSSLWNKYGYDNTPPLQINAYNGVSCDVALIFTWGPEAYVLYVGWLNNDRMDSVCLGPRQRGYCP